MCIVFATKSLNFDVLLNKISLLETDFVAFGVTSPVRKMRNLDSIYL